MLNYSIIIPHKNCPDLLQRCVDSIPDRDDVQIIVVDDNSDEGKKPCIGRKEVEVILLDAAHSKGAGRARNVGLEHAKGKWLLFADADDYYTDYLPVLLDKYADDEETDIVYLNAHVFDENGNTSTYLSDKLIADYLAGKCQSEKRLKYGMWTPWTRMIKQSVVNDMNIKFDELPACNDKMFCLSCSHYSKHIKVENNFVYMYFKPTQGSQTDKKRNNLMLQGLMGVRSRTIVMYKEASYKPIPSLFKLVFRSKYSKGLHVKDLFHIYIDAIKETHISMFEDFYHYFKR